MKTKKEQNNAPKKELKSSPKRAPTFKDHFAKLYDKARNNRLNWMDFEELVKIMKEPKNYDELNITTGIIFNKAKVIFKAMGEAISLSNLNIKDASERLEKAIEKSNAIISKDREALSADEKIEWDRAKQQIEQYNKLKETLQVYNGVRDSRMKPIKYFLAKFRKKEIKPLQASKSENNQNNKDNKSANSLSATLTSQVKTGDEIGSEVPQSQPPVNNPPQI